MTTHAMIDIETLDTIPTATVLTIGACKFDPYSNQTPHNRMLWRPDIDEQLEKGRSISDSTLEWWSKQDSGVQDSTFTNDGRISVSDTFKYLNKYLVGVDKIWCQGPQFDMVILEDMYRQFGMHTNWAFWQIMDSRTIFNIMPRDPRKAIQVDAHDAAEDAYWQAVAVQRTFEHFNVNKP